MSAEIKHTSIDGREGQKPRSRKSTYLFAFAFVATVCMTVFGVISAQNRRRAPVAAPSETWAPRISEVVHGGVVSSGIGLKSSTTEEATGTLRVQIPNGSAVRAAWLYSSAYNFNGGGIRAIPGHRFVRIGEGANTQTRNLEGNGDSTRREPLPSFNGRPSYHLFTTNVTNTLRALATAARSGTFNVAIAERGDDAEASNIWIAGHTLVVEYELNRLPPRIVVVADGVTPIPQTAATAYTQTLTLPAAIGSQCNRTQLGYDPAVLTMAFALDLAGCDENATVRVNGAVVSTRSGGTDDMTPAPTGTCIQTGGAGAEGLYTVGNLGADARGRPVGMTPDSLDNAGGRSDDELWEIASLAPGATTLPISVFKTVSRAGDTTDIPVVIFQARAASDDGDADGDHVPDAQEGACTRTDVDLDGLADYLDVDSDNDCSLDSAEPGAARTTVARDPHANCRDTDECTADRCTAGVCSHPPRDLGATCSLGACTGGADSTCVQCVADNNCGGSTPYCEVNSHTCRACLNAGHCTDQNNCTGDTCSSEGSCVFTALPTAQSCEGGVCNGVAAAPMCVQCVSDAQCSGNTPRCDTSTNRCAQCITDAQCNDGNGCTTDTCSGGACAHISQAPGTACSGGVCNGAASAPQCVACVSDAQCGGNTSHCDVARSRCVQCVGAGDCNDNNSCTQDSCVAGSCQNRSTPAGQTCEAGYCNGTSRCVACLNAGHCNDSVECTVDTCNPNGTCSSRPSSRGTSCAGGVCNGAAAPMCVACVSDSQCSGATPHCNTQTSQCQACLNNAQCNDSNMCTNDVCTNGSCSNPAMASAAPCGRGVCDTSGSTPACVSCLSDAQCRGQTSHCNVGQHECQQCTTAAHCDDNNPCTTDSCGANGTCSNRPAASGTTCPTGFCNGRTSCVQCVADGQCGDTNACTTDTCSNGRCTHPAARRGTTCPNGVCNGGSDANACVSCLDNSQCGGATACCDSRAHQCIACPPPPPPRAPRTPRTPRTRR
ncbi:MAG: hypothetical protein IPK60_25280 [Sandaracinaceae bacterium]|nr:hypothetical protein [Sandaracinaceae bacterium]